MNYATHALQPSDYALTREGLAALRVELATLRDKRTGLSDGGTSHEERALVEARIATLEEVLHAAWVVDPTEVEPGVVAIGTAVTLRDVDLDQSERYRVVGKHEPLRSGELSAASAVGQALVGRRVGEAVTVDLPSGRSRRLEVTSAEPAVGDR
jgi:transcription elongation factor GreA